jgi:hypothetical protein
MCLQPTVKWRPIELGSIRHKEQFVGDSEPEGVEAFVGVNGFFTCPVPFWRLFPPRWESRGRKSHSELSGEREADRLVRRVAPPLARL